MDILFMLIYKSRIRGYNFVYAMCWPCNYTDFAPDKMWLTPSKYNIGIYCQ